MNTENLKTLLRVYNEGAAWGKDYPAGYQTIRINGEIIEGQRDPLKRLALIPIDFKGKSVLDIGCNNGGILLSLADRIYWGRGIDYDPKLINIANMIKKMKFIDWVDFYKFDLENEPLDLIKFFMPQPKVDVIFFMSMCLHLQNWREVIDFSNSIGKQVIFETNGNADQQLQQLHYVVMVKNKEAKQLTSSSEDDKIFQNRSLYLIEN